MNKITATQPYFFLRTNNQFIKVYFEEVIYIEGCKNYAKIYTKTKNYVVLTTLKKLEEQLADHYFCRTHRSFIVSINYVTSFDYYNVNITAGAALNKTIPLGERYREVLRRKVTILGTDSSEAKESIIIDAVKIELEHQAVA